MRLTKATPKAVRYACLNFHYAKAVPSAKYAYNVFNDHDEWCGVIIYSSGANNHIGTEFNLFQGEILELVRVALNGKQECTSQAVAMTLRELHRTNRLIKAIVSYSDIDQHHYGTIYQALNFIYLGDRLVNKKDGSFIIHGKRVHGKSLSDKYGTHNEKFLRDNIDPNVKAYITAGKRKYILFYDKKLRKIWQKKALPYPKANK